MKRCTLRGHPKIFWGIRPYFGSGAVEAQSAKLEATKKRPPVIGNCQLVIGKLDHGSSQLPRVSYVNKCKVSYSGAKALLKPH
ncbi:hypothetical protein CEN44_17830 [Fischerella muscicola CCMEE 5323]|uniref:Uncharacterized protein n=2 Tax=Hapalosiphonaceae TaxID=1892263 RepID=A0A2N6K052_FISMU|nr:hypothetical protein CEN44_17830 [Fischerella muscicola CCMEE 5323]